jgi:lipopolysaccharide export system permease protein
MIMKRVDRYLARTVILNTLMTWLVLLVIVMVLGFVGELRSSQENYGPLQGVFFIFMTMPRQAVQIFPIAALIGTLLGAGGLASQLELVAFRSAGVSRMRLAASVLIGGLLLLLPVLWMAEYLVPEMEYNARAYRVTKQSGRVHLGGSGGMWLREGGRIVNIRQPLITADIDAQDVRFSEVLIFSLDEDMLIESISSADEARPQGDSWILDDVKEITFTPDRISTVETAAKNWQIELDSGLLEAAVTRPGYLSVRALSSYVRYLAGHDQDARQYVSAYWQKIAYPFSVLALVLAAMPFLFGSNRQNTLGIRMFTGTVVGAAFLIFSRLMENFADAYALPAWLGAFFPVAVLAALSIIALKRTS